MQIAQIEPEAIVTIASGESCAKKKESLNQQAFFVKLFSFCANADYNKKSYNFQGHAPWKLYLGALRMSSVCEARGASAQCSQKPTEMLAFRVESEATKKHPKIKRFSGESEA